MAASMVRQCIQSSLPRQVTEIVWREQNINHALQILSMLHIQHQYYHVTMPLFKRRHVEESQKDELIFDNNVLSNFSYKQSKKKSLSIVETWNNMTVQELANSAKRDVEDILDALYFESRNSTYTKNSILTDGHLIHKVVQRLGAKSKLVSKCIKKVDIEDKDIIRRPLPDSSELVKRHPVVTIMGHVDHGKTTLLDALRHTSVAQSEFGGITQCIGAFNVTLDSGERVTFLDTPGHAAFTSMRYRGAYVTDIVVLVVAADDGVKEQTLQSIKMAKNANVPIIVAINKIDKPDIDIEKIQNELANYGVVVEKLGGEVQCIKLSALKGTNLQELTEAIVVQAELMDLKGDPTGLVEGVAIECSNQIYRGNLVTALIQRGTLKKGCLLVSGLASAKVRSIFNDSGHSILEAKPSDAVQITGWKELPNVGDEILEVENNKVLQDVLKFREKKRDEILAKEHKAAADERLQEHLIEYRKLLEVKRTFGREKLKELKLKLQEEKRKPKIVDSISKINIIIKGDVAGSVEALLDIFDTYKYDTICRLNIVHYGIGPVTNSDIELADTFEAIIYGFNVNAIKTIKEMADARGVSLRFYNVVYKLIDNIKEEIHNVLPEVDTEEIIGEAKVLQKFEINEKNKKVSVAGCRCVKGVLLKSEMYRVIRGNETIFTGKLVSMRHLKNEMSSIEANLECGLRFEDPKVSLQSGDTIICFKLNREKQKLDWDPGF
ncbi:translation initiation factor IF-2, mitochondrial isoform X1 [Frieseomelitta varia]|uniref:translation initiation factor IF-2, mitochondrial isoform X1 n=2 Tax=Frieseomelitta varia TaxID=561572 RepID=UPI001CB6AF1D|nr:translation initiation factor IF-2, mitochondrial isoform X1 [Frieseomelitta varia]